ncbi:PREDICTED: probable FBD-associated F-box protein At1g32375 [Camelina sativa]|uniref:Probable FBD-associated F-box protein At1g32375 n=1 Tax=Camelina sativa TaxID=90675 RepID=A0ABM1R647_CAMSA|nr:PREDICTED: probable FBD-associated F-box protein At1g32375 [Camelina sativa]
MDQLPEELLLRILSFLPTMKDVVATMVLSKQWKSLWMFVPELVYDDSYQSIDYERFSRFVDRSLFLHEAPVIETLYFKLGQTCGAEDIRVWIRAAEKFSVRELHIKFVSPSDASPTILPRSLYTRCRMLVTLILVEAVLVDDVNCPISFPSLKLLHLVYLTYPGGDEFVNKLLSSCPVLEKLVVMQFPGDNVTIFTIRVPSLKHLRMLKPLQHYSDNAHGFVIDVPSLETLEIVDYTDGFCVIENEMPNIVRASIDCNQTHRGRIILSSIIMSVKCLFLCLPTSEVFSCMQDAYHVGSIFHHLVELTLCTCDEQWLNLLLRLLGDSPKLRSLRLIQVHNPCWIKPSPCWIKPSSVPKCLLSSFETLECRDYEGKEEEKELLGYILRNGSCLKKVTVSSTSTDSEKKLEMIKEELLSIRRSPTCQLVFN